MKKENYYKIMWTLSCLLVLIFFVIIVIDYYKYNPLTNSAPFSIYFIIRGLEFLLPSIIIFIVGIICKRKLNKK